MIKWRWILSLFLTLVVLLAGQFFLFRFMPVYNLCLKTYVSDNSWWVGQKARVLILGGSNAMNGIHAPHLAKMLNMGKNDIRNLGMNGATCFEALNTLNKYLDRFEPPERVYITLSPSLCYEYVHLKKDYEKILVTKKQWDYAERHEDISHMYYYPVNLFLESLKFDRMYKFRQYHLQLDATRERMGFQPGTHLGFEDDEKEVLRRVPRNKQVYPVSEFQIQSLASIQKRCEDLGIQFFVVLTPVYDTLYDYYVADPDLFSDLAQMFNQKLAPVRVLGSLNPKDYGLKYTHFMNIDHISESGAVIFTESLFNDYSLHPQIKPAKFKRPHLYHRSQSLE